LENLGMDGRVMLKWTIKKTAGGCGQDLCDCGWL
jgi:hypothetical protein